MSNAHLALLAQADSSGLADACGDAPSAVCRFVYEQTDDVAVAKVVNWLAHIPAQIVLILLAAWILKRLARRGIQRFAFRVQGLSQADGIKKFRSRGPAVFIDTGEVNVRAESRAETISVVLGSLASTLISVLAFIYIVGALGLDLGPLIAGAGLAGVALGFGAQSLVKDYISGTFMIIEDQYGVGDVVDLGEASGTVERVTLRSTRLRDVNGTVWHVPNGEVLRVGNKSQQWARAVLDVAVAPDADLERVAAIIESAAEDVWSSEAAAADVLDAPEVLGLEYLGPDAATIRLQGRTRPGAQWRVSRLLRVRIADALLSEGIKLPPASFIRPGVSGPGT